MTLDRSKRPRLFGGPPSESAWLYALAGALLLAGPAWAYLWTERYPARAELWLLVGGPALVGAVGALIARRVGGLLGTLGFAALMYAFVDLQADVESYSRLPVKLAHAIAFALVLALAAMLKRHRATIACITLGAFYLSSLPRGGERTFMRGVTDTRAGDASLPLLLHVILDEQWGIGGFRAEGDTATARFLEEFYASRGFEVYPAAYSRYEHTFESIPSVISLGRSSPGDLADDRARPRYFYRLRENAYFDTLRARGYQIRVMQSDYVNFCDTADAPVAWCETESGNSIANIGRFEGSAVVRARLAARYFLATKSRVARLLGQDAESWRRASAGGGLHALRHLRDSIAAGPRGGVAYFAHVLVPHRPLRVDADCRVVEDIEGHVGYEQPSRLTDSVWAATLAMEGGQVRCAHRMLRAVLDALDARVGRDGAVVLVHGDHGARVFQRRPPREGLSPLDDRQLNGRYATLLAVRRPRVPSRVERAPVPLQDFVWDLVGRNFAGAVPLEFRHYVRASYADRAGADSLRMLTPASMPWAR